MGDEQCTHHTVWYSPVGGMAMGWTPRWICEVCGCEFAPEGPLRARIAELEAERDRLRDKALRFDLDRVGVESREAEAVELVEARARIRELEARLKQVHDALGECASAYPGVAVTVECVVATAKNLRALADANEKRIAELEAERDRWREALAEDIESLRIADAQTTEAEAELARLRDGVRRMAKQDCEAEGPHAEPEVMCHESGQPRSVWCLSCQARELLRKEPGDA